MNLAKIIRTHRNRFKFIPITLSKTKVLNSKEVTYIVKLKNLGIGKIE